MKRLSPLVVSLLLLVGCVSLPTNGVVQEGLERAPEPEGIVFLAPDPQPGVDPIGIVSGFLDAATAGVADRYETAQKYLTDSARQSWVPGAGVTIYSGNTPPKVNLVGPRRVSVSVPIAGRVDAHGVYSQEDDGVERSSFFTLTEVDGEWRISDLEDGVLISSVNFGTQFRQASLAFLSPDKKYLIPDPRWFPEQNAASFAVTALLQGPAPWLAPGVFSAIPSGTSAQPVNVNDGAAEVRLSQAALSASPTDREMVVAQLETTLTDLPQVYRVNTSVDGNTYLDGGARFTFEGESAVGHTPYVVTDTEVGTVIGTNVNPIPDLNVDEARDYANLAVPYGELESGGLPLVAQVGRGRIEALGSLADSDPLITGKNLLAPSYDPYGWLWSGEQVNTGSLLATEPGSNAVSVVNAPDLREHRVRSIRLSRDGARIAIILQRGSDTEIQVAIVLRDEDGTPVGIGEPRSISSRIPDAGSLVWIDPVTLGVLALSDDGTASIHTVPLSGPPVSLLSVQGATALAAGRGERELWVTTSSGELFTRAGNGWRKVNDDQGVRTIAFPG